MIADYITTKSLPLVPLQPSLALHWLVVNGIQPLIPENPSKPTSHKTNHALDQLPQSFSREIQQFYARLTDIFESCDRASLHIALHILQTDTGLQLLIPYLSRFLALQIKKHLKSLRHLSVSVQAISRLVLNPHIVLDAHVEQLMPAILTTVLGSKLSASPLQDHWTLRQLSADVVASLCSKYRDSFPDLQAQVCQTYLNELRASTAPANRTFAPLFGSIVGLSALGPAVIRSLLLPELATMERILFDKLDHSDGPDTALVIERERCLAALTTAIGESFVLLSAVCSAYGLTACV